MIIYSRIIILQELELCIYTSTYSRIRIMYIENYVYILIHIQELELCRYNHANDFV